MMLSGEQVLRGIPLGVGQIFACGSLGPSLLILAGLCLYSPLQAIHALLGSAIGTLAGEFQPPKEESMITTGNGNGVYIWHPELEFS